MSGVSRQFFHHLPPPMPLQQLRVIHILPASQSGGPAHQMPPVDKPGQQFPEAAPPAEVIGMIEAGGAGVETKWAGIHAQEIVILLPCPSSVGADSRLDRQQGNPVLLQAPGPSLPPCLPDPSVLLLCDDNPPQLTVKRKIGRDAHPTGPCCPHRLNERRLHSQRKPGSIPRNAFSTCSLPVMRASCPAVFEPRQPGYWGSYKGMEVACMVMDGFTHPIPKAFQAATH